MLKRILRLLLQIILFIGIVMAFAFSVRVTDPDLGKLFSSSAQARQIIDPLLRPDLVTRDSETRFLSLDFPVPCGSAPEGEALGSGPRIEIEPGCAEVGETVLLRGSGLPENTDVVVRWRLSSEGTLSLQRLTTDAEGHFELEVQARAIATTQEGVAPQIEAEYTLPGGTLHLSQAFKDVINEIFVTFLMALLATTIGTIIAAPISFVASQNITRIGCVGSGAYYLSRSFLNIIRSFEVLVVASIFALIVGYGKPFAGIIAMVFVTTASLGKMFSESVEGIDPGSIEALTATGANRFQVIMHGVVPQVIPDFLSYIIYHWDINIRISTIVGFVGGGGIGFYLSERLKSFEYAKASTAIIVIVVIVMALDFLSAEIRKRLT
ncbi:MAG: phosphonate ABC transporter, permease protein PhnE [Anaerolineales bacterium]|nr:phosphonate ABC transporter, permease protein PhnE [Anaerolineales bacterium]